MAANFDDEQKRMAEAQADIAELMSQLMQMRSALTTPTMGMEGQLQGPMVDALQAALGNQQERGGVPRLRLQADPFNPFGGPPPDMERDAQIFGPSSGAPADVAPIFPGGAGGGGRVVGGDDAGPARPPAGDRAPMKKRR